MPEPAVEHIRVRARRDRATARERQAAVLPAAGGDLAAGIRRHARLTVNFHPDRVARDGAIVAAGLRHHGRYRSQFETGLSGGGRMAVAGGGRPEWERQLFGGVYDDPSRTRPVYGALDLTHDPHGGSPRFGSTFLVLDSGCWERTTFTVGDSHLGPTDVGTIVELDAVLAGVLEAAVTGDGLGRGMSIEDLRRCAEEGEHAAEPARDLDHYVEAQVHGGVQLAGDVQAIVVDPSFRGTEVAAELEALARTHDIDLDWHGGSVLAVDDVPDDFRGPTMPTLARRVAGDDGMVDAAAIRRSLLAVALPPMRPEGDPADGALQQHKYLWHCALRFGEDARR
ncbi:MAG: DUF3626 domain-containing protein [Acidimicrobiia bacterium]|nr:DUF3626 domain-containing protein [Acidimicrobiia bacterium]